MIVHTARAVHHEHEVEVRVEPDDLFEVFLLFLKLKPGNFIVTIGFKLY